LPSEFIGYELKLVPQKVKLGEEKPQEWKLEFIMEGMKE